MTQKKWKFNFFDIVIILLVVVVVGVGYAMTKKTVVVETKKQRYQVELIECPAGLSESVVIGGHIYDAIKNYEMGTVVEMEKKDTTRPSEDRVDGVIKDSIMPGVENIVLTVEADVVESASELRVPSGYVIKAGKEAMVKGSGYAGRGFIITVER